MPSANTSAFLPTGCPASTSGGINPSVPASRRLPVDSLSISIRAEPKSIRTGPSAPIMMLFGVISRCEIPLSCSSATTSANLLIIPRASDVGSGPWLSRNDRRVSPSTNSEAIQGSSDDKSALMCFATPRESTRDKTSFSRPTRSSCHGRSKSTRRKTFIARRLPFGSKPS